MKSSMLLVALALPFIQTEPGDPPKGSVQQRAQFERRQAHQMEFEQSLFVDAGFAPLADLARAGRNVRRALFEDPYMMLPIPGVEIERLSDGTVTLKVVGPAIESKAVKLPTSAWAHLTNLEGATLSPKAYSPWDPLKAGQPIPPPPPICHGWIVRFGKSEDGARSSGSWAQCGGKDEPGREFAAEMARLAVQTRPDCAFDAAQPFWSFSTCFTSEHKPTEPERSPIHKKSSSFTI